MPPVTVIGTTTLLRIPVLVVRRKLIMILLLILVLIDLRVTVTTPVTALVLMLVQLLVPQVMLVGATLLDNTLFMHFRPSYHGKQQSE
jgi:hypothetical protein